MGGKGWQVPQMTIAQTAIIVQTDFNDARVQAGVQKVAQAQENTRQNAPINARCT